MSIRLAVPLTFYYLKPPAHRLLLIALLPKSVIIIRSQKKNRFWSFCNESKMVIVLFFGFLIIKGYSLHYSFYYIITIA